MTRNSDKDKIAQRDSEKFLSNSKVEVEMLRHNFATQHDNIYCRGKVTQIKNCSENDSDGSNIVLLNIKGTQTSFFRASNKLKRVHLLVIELEHLSFGFAVTDIKPKRP